jgi:hypothetical protein
LRYCGEEQTINEIAGKHQLSPVMISRWKSEFLERAPLSVWTSGRRNYLESAAPALIGNRKSSKQKNAFANDGIYNSLMSHADEIQKHQDDAKNVANGLKSLKNVLNAQSGKQIDKAFADQALSIIDTLSAKY